jgi:hypothetical protein
LTIANLGSYSVVSDFGRVEFDNSTELDGCAD